MHKGNKQATLVLATRVTLVVGLLCGLAIVDGQLLSDLSQPAYYVDQSVLGANSAELGQGQDSIYYWPLIDQLKPQSAGDSLLAYQSPALNEAIINEQLLEGLNSELKRQARLESEKSSRQELIDALSYLKQETPQPGSEQDGQLKISPPVNNPLEFEAAARIMKQLPLVMANNNNLSSSASDLVSLDTMLSLYLSNLVKEIDDDPKKADSEHHHQAGESGPEQQTPAAKESDQEERKQQQEGETTTSASRYGSAEYIDHPLAIIGHQYVQGGAGEGKQLLGPDGTFENVQVVKTDHAVPSYCDPPNPCPIGFTAEDGCLEKFVNSASSSREYQAKQQCSCDNEHSLFNCASPISTLKGDLFGATESGLGGQTNKLADSPKQMKDGDDADDDNGIETGHGRLETLARTIQNRFGSLSSIRNLISSRDTTPLVD